jgi:parvulin-like peptidyl-prolyl isomerase
MDDQMSSAISVLRDEGYDDAAQVLQDKALSDIKAKANEVLAKIKSGELTFEQATEQYNEDTGMTDEGYPVVADNTSYVEAFTDAAMGLKKVGDMTDLVASDYGYHIIEYYKDQTPGAVAYEDVKDEIQSELESSKQTEAWNAKLDEWEAAASIKKYS